MAALLILDGYTLEAQIPERGPFPSLLFRYRPALPDAASEYLRGPRVNQKATKHMTDFLEKYLKGWDVTDVEDKPVEINANSLSRVPFPYLEALVQYVLTYATDGAHEYAEKN